MLYCISSHQKALLHIHTGWRILFRVQIRLAAASASTIGRVDSCNNPVCVVWVNIRPPELCRVSVVTGAICYVAVSTGKRHTLASPCSRASIATIATLAEPPKQGTKGNQASGSNS